MFEKEITVNLINQLMNMETLTINKKSFVVIEQKEFNKIQLFAAQKSNPVKKLSFFACKKYAYKKVDKWATTYSF